MKDTQDIQTRIAGRKWFHSIDLGGGVVTPGSVPPEYLKAFLRHVQFPDRFDGLSVLDVGTYDGFFAFEAEKRGAARVVAIDVTPPDCFGFATAKEILGSNVEYHHMSAYNVDVDKLNGPFDVVLFFGVFYHLRYPLLALDQLWNAVRGYMLMETHIIDHHFVLADGSVAELAELDPRLAKVPLYRFYRLNELNPGDYSNWFGPNIEAVQQGLQSAGFEAELLATWASSSFWTPGKGLRAAFRAKKCEGLQEFRRGSYEGTRFEYDREGRWNVVWHPPERHE